jgi:DNA-binding transcriptional LysR family regulator
VRLTSEGRALVEPARRALHAAAAATQAVREVQQVITGQLRIGVVRSALHLLPLIDDVARFSAEHPHVEVSILQLPVATTLHRVAGGDLDCGIVTAIPTTVPGVRLVPLFEEPLVLVCRGDHPFANRSVVDLGDLEGERVIDVQADWSARTMVDAALSAAGVTRAVVFEVNEWELLLNLIEAGAGIGLVPEGVARHAVGDTSSVLRSVAVAHHQLRRHIQLALPRYGDLSPAAKEFMRTANLDASHAHDVPT